MAWIHVPGLAGKVYVPDDGGQLRKKHPCKACFSCQWCDENRCQVCRSDRAEADAIKEQCCCRQRQLSRPANHNCQAPTPK
jgi:hypothetical protein